MQPTDEETNTHGCVATVVIARRMSPRTMLPPPPSEPPILIHTCTSFCMMLATLVCALQDTSGIWEGGGHEVGNQSGVKPVIHPSGPTWGRGGKGSEGV